MLMIGFQAVLKDQPVRAKPTYNQQYSPQQSQGNGPGPQPNNYMNQMSGGNLGMMGYQSNDLLNALTLLQANSNQQYQSQMKLAPSPQLNQRSNLRPRTTPMPKRIHQKKPKPQPKPTKNKTAGLLNNLF